MIHGVNLTEACVYSVFILYTPDSYVANLTSASLLGHFLGVRDSLFQKAKSGIWVCYHKENFNDNGEDIDNIYFIA